MSMHTAGVLSGIFTGLLILIFIGIIAWAWSGRRRPVYEAAARLPLEEDTKSKSDDREQAL